jgi:hypothetical protein
MLHHGVTVNRSHKDNENTFSILNLDNFKYIDNLTPADELSKQELISVMVRTATLLKYVESVINGARRFLLPFSFRGALREQPPRLEKDMETLCHVSNSSASEQLI